MPVRQVNVRLPIMLIILLVCNSTARKLTNNKACAIVNIVNLKTNMSEELSSFPLEPTGDVSQVSQGSNLYEIDVDLGDSPYERAPTASGHQGSAMATKEADIAAAEQSVASEAEAIMAHVRAMQERYGYYSLAEHGLGEAEKEAHGTAVHIGQLSLLSAITPSPEEADMSVWASKPLPSEGVRKKRYETIFTPRPLLSELEKPYEIPYAERRYYPEVTTESREASKQRLADIRMTDIEVDRILDRHGAAIDADKRTEVIERIRTDAALRYDLGVHFLDKIQTLYRKMPDRIRDDTDKNPSFGRYPNELRELIKSGRPLGGREYASLLALSMLDGTYSERPSDPIEYGYDGRAVQGVHRAAAELLLQ